MWEAGEYDINTLYAYEKMSDLYISLGTGDFNEFEGTEFTELNMNRHWTFIEAGKSKW